MGTPNLVGFLAWRWGRGRIRLAVLDVLALANFLKILVLRLLVLRDFFRCGQPVDTVDDARRGLSRVALAHYAKLVMVEVDHSIDEVVLAQIFGFQAASPLVL